MIKNSYSRTKGAHGCCVLFYICPIRGPLPRYVTPEQKKNEKKASTHTSRSSVRRSNLNRLACLTQHDAALTASLILGSVDSNDSNENLSALLRERGRDAARRVVLNTPHPLTVLSDPKAYGNAGSISRHHNPFNYLRALGKTRRVWENGSQPRRNDVADALGSRDEDE